MRAAFAFAMSAFTMSAFTMSALATSVIFPVSAAAQDAKPQEPDRPVSDQTTTMGDAVTTPVSDLNLKKDSIPPLLLTAQAKPYDLTGLRRCGEIAAAVGELDAVLGPDIDLPAEAKGGASAGSVAQAAVGAFIPFRGLIRELSGANEQVRKIQAAVQAGIARRSYLKGLGAARGCRYPARAAGPVEIAALTAATPKAKEDPGTPARSDAAPTAKPSRKVRTKRRSGVTFVSDPVVQDTKK